MNLKLLKTLEKKVKKAERRPGFETITVIVLGVKEKGQDENKFYTVDGELYTGEGESGHVIRITRRRA